MGLLSFQKLKESFSVLRSDFEKGILPEAPPAEGGSVIGAAFAVFTTPVTYSFGLAASAAEGVKRAVTGVSPQRESQIAFLERILESLPEISNPSYKDARIKDATWRSYVFLGACMVVIKQIEDNEAVFNSRLKSVIKGKLDLLIATTEHKTFDNLTTNIKENALKAILGLLNSEFDCASLEEAYCDTIKPIVGSMLKAVQAEIATASRQLTAK